MFPFYLRLMVSKTGDFCPWEILDPCPTVPRNFVTDFSFTELRFSVPQCLLEYPKVLEMYHTLEYLIQLELAMYGLVGWVKSR